MLTGPALDNLAAAVVRACRAGLDADALRAAVLPRLRKAVPIDALWWAAADPATLLFTQSYREELPEESGPYFVENEFLHQDVNKWTELARDPAGVRTLMEATGGHPARSERYRDIFAPLGLQDELRAVLRVRDACWGYICLHREAAQATFSRDEARFVQRLAPHLAEGLRTGLLRQACDLEDTADSPGLVILGADGAVAGMNDAAGRWLEDLGGRADGSDLPIEISAVATRLRHLDASAPAMPRLRVRARTGRWATPARLLDEFPRRQDDHGDSRGGRSRRGRTGDHVCVRPDRSREDDMRAGLPGPSDQADRGPAAPDHRHRARSPEIRLQKDRRAQPR